VAVQPEPNVTTTQISAFATSIGMTGTLSITDKKQIASMIIDQRGNALLADQNAAIREQNALTREWIDVLKAKTA
jgi:hypothetical protein